MTILAIPIALVMTPMLRGAVPCACACTPRACRQSRSVGAVGPKIEVFADRCHRPTVDHRAVAGGCRAANRSRLCECERTDQGECNPENECFELHASFPSIPGTEQRPARLVAPGDSEIADHDRSHPATRLGEPSRPEDERPILVSICRASCRDRRPCDRRPFCRRQGRHLIRCRSRCRSRLQLRARCRRWTLSGHCRSEPCASRFS